MTYINKYHYSGRAGIVGGARPKTVQQIPAKSIQIYCDENADPSVAPVQTGEWTKAPHRDHVNKENEKKAGVWNKAKVGVVIPPAKRSFRGVYCFQPVRHSVIPSFRDSVIPSFRHSVNIWTSLLNNLSSFCLICFKFSPHLHHQTIHVWYEFRGQRVSIARVMGLFKSPYNMFALVLKVHTL